jgi:hypothetical protein
MSDGAKPGRGKLDRRTAGRLAGAAALVVVLGAILGPAILTTHPTPTTAGATGFAANPSSSPPPSGPRGPTAPAEPWSDLDVPPFEPLAEFTPNDENRNGVVVASSFTLRSLTDTPALELARGIHLEPRVAFTVKAGPTADVAIVEPVDSLHEDLRYRVRLDAPDGALAGSWTFTTEAPLRIVGTLPADRSTQVPLNTGIEVEFDQDGTKGVADHVRIAPPISGRFEHHDRVWVFVPDKPLAATTIYTVTVTAGVEINGSTQRLETGTSFRFETDTATPASAGPGVGFDRTIFETRPGERPVLSLGEWYDDDDGGGGPPKTVTVKVHRLPTFADAVDAAIALAGPDSWALYAPTATVDTGNLALVASVDGTVLRSDAGLFLRLPFEPTAGQYILTIGDARFGSQLLLQVTNMAAYAVTGEQDSVVWANDLGAGTALAVATVAVVRGDELGATDSSGLLRVPTPAAFLAKPASDEADPVPHFLVVRAADGRRLLVPIGLRMAWYWGGYDGGYSYNGGSAEWWHLFRTDRQAYRQTDTINISGMVRARADRSVPGRVEIRLRASDGPEELAIERLRLVPSDRGVFSGSLHVNGLPHGEYVLDLVAGGARVDSVWIEVTEIRKPAFHIDVETDRHVYVLGEQVRISASAAFFDGTPVPGMDLRFSAFDTSATATSDVLGGATARLRAASSSAPEGWFSDYLSVVPAHPEEGSIEGDAQVVLLPSRFWVAGTGSLTDGKVVANGTLTWADIAGMEAKVAAGGYLDDEGDGPGKPISGGTVRVTVIRHYTVRTQQGNEYDFIEKRVLPVYDYDYRDERLGAWTITSAADGAFRLSVPARAATDDYEIILSATDPEGRTFVRTLWVSAPYEPRNHQAPYLGLQGFCGFRPQLTAHLDEPFNVTMRDGTGATAASGKFLFLVTERGSMQTTIQDVATFSRTLRDADLPGFTVRGIWLTDDGYFVADAAAEVDPDDKRLTIKLVPDKARYQPGGHATIAITTTGPNGEPVAADVVVQGVDEKLYSIGIAGDADPAPQLMQGTSSGLIQSYTTHSMPTYDPGGCGGTGGGDRSDFRDTVTFQRVTTGANGRGVVEFDLSDDRTSWHVTATGVDDALDSGFAAVQLPVGLPFFVDAVLAPEYLVGEDPILRVRTFGRALSADDSVRLTVEAPSLGLEPTIVRGRAFEALRIALPTLVAGDHRVRIAAEATVGGRTYRDALIRTIHVVGSRLAGLVSSYDMLVPGFAPEGGPGLTTYSITDAGRGRLIELLEELTWDGSARFDKLAAAAVARRLLMDEFGIADGSLRPSDFDPSRYQRGGIALLPYSTPDLFLSARTALVVPDLVDQSALRSALEELGSDDIATRERAIVALAGRAGLGDDVLDELHGYNSSELTVREQLWLALGLAATGDEASARAIERQLLESAGQRLGPWVRLAAGRTQHDTLEATGLLLLLAGRLGDPLAHDVSKYLLEARSNEFVFPLEQMGYIEGFLDRLPRNPGKFAWTVDGERHVVKLPPGGGTSLVLTAEQRASFSLERLDGDLAVVTSWVSPDFQRPQGPSIRIQRTVDPVDDAPDDRLVKVRFIVTFGAVVGPGCYRLTDFAPSGLTPLYGTAGWPDEEAQFSSNDVGPYSIDGQVVSWCASPDHAYRYVYAARVVSPGTYRWEEALLQYEFDPTIGATTEAGTYTIR